MVKETNTSTLFVPVLATLVSILHTSKNLIQHCPSLKFTHKARFDLYNLNRPTYQWLTMLNRGHTYAETNTKATAPDGKLSTDIVKQNVIRRTRRYTMTLIAR